MHEIECLSEIICPLRTFSATSTEGKCAAHVSERLGSNYAKNLPPIPAEQMVPGGLYKQMFFQHGHKSKSGSQIPSEKTQTLAADKTANMIMDDFGVEVLNNLEYKSGISGSDLKTYKFPFNVPNEVVSCSANSEKALAPCESVASTQRHSGGEAQNEVIRFGDCSEPCEATDATSVLDPLWKALMMPVEVCHREVPSGLFHIYIYIYFKDCVTIKCMVYLIGVWLFYT